MSRWRWVVIWIALATAVGLAVVSEPQSYAHLFLTGKCFAKPEPRHCHPKVGSRGG